MPTSPISTLHQLILTQFTISFGAPDHSVGKDMHWGLRPAPAMPPVNVLVNGSAERPIVWVFDPYDPASNVHHEEVREAPAVDRLVVLIRGKMQAAITPGDGRGA